jgi:serine/threonine-protein kinase
MSSDPSSKRPRRSVRVGKYEVVAHIATGGMGAVYKAIDTVLKREVALKVLPPDMASKPGALERFRREARNAARLRHENIVTIYEFDQNGTTFYLAMEFVEGIDLAEYIERKGRVDPEEARIITIQAAHALEHAYTQGIVHRDIKPSNFLVTRKGDRLLVKMSDFGLARETSEEEARVTRVGHTVGTVDYMAPEQARDCGSADIRSDIYSLGCTLFHMLTGRAPFPEGCIPERLYKHAHEEPADVRQLNPRVSEAFCAVVRRMLLKNPDDRYSTPGALLKDLVRLESATAPLAAPDVLAGLALAADEAPAEASRVRRRPAGSERPSRPPLPSLPPPRPRGRRGEAPPVEEPEPVADEPTPRGPWLWIIAGGVLALVLVVVGIILGLRTTEPPPRDPITQGPPSPTAVPPPVDTGRGPDPIVRPPETPKGPKEPSRPLWPMLYEPATPLDKESLTRDFLGPWAEQNDPGPKVPILRVSRPASGAGAFPSLEAACAAAPADQLTVIEIADNGPIFQTPIAVVDRSLFLRAAKGYRPLLVWEVDKGRDAERDGKAAPASFLALARGSLTLDRLDLVVKWSEPASVGRPFLVRVTDGDFLARDCTFSLSSRQPADLGAVRFERSSVGGPARSGSGHCRLSRCVARGPGLVALDLDFPGADVLCDGCLLIGTDQPLLRVAGRNSQVPAMLRLLRSTLVANQTLLQVQPVTPVDTWPELKVQTWDALLTRGGTEAGGQMVVLVNSRAARVKWEAVNSLFTGWRNLLTAADRSAADRGSWQAVWQRNEGELALAPPWPAVIHPDPSEAAVEEYRPNPAPTSLVGYAATSGAGPLGCDSSVLPPARTNWLALAYDSYPAPTLDPINDATAPPILAASDSHYHGGRIDLAQTPDLGAFLDEMARTKGLGPRVVLRLAGSGEQQTRPIRIRGSSLVLYFEPVEAEAKPLTLVPHKETLPEGEALIEVDGGGLDVIGGSVRFPDFNTALVPPYAVKVRGGDLRLFRCRLDGPLQHPPPAYRGLIRFEGRSGDAAPAKPHGCSLNESVLVSMRNCVHVAGGGARLGLQQCVILAGEDAIHFAPGATATPRLDVQCLLDQTTVAARHAVVRLSDAPQLEGPVEPIIMQTRFCDFANPFTDAPEATLLAADDGALARGLLVWQGGSNAFDRRLASGTPAWAKLWGRTWELQQILDVPLKGTISRDKPELERLALPPGLLKPLPGEEKRPPPGADFELLGLLKKPAKPPR